jgi:ferric-dicitrate binding protein FerR (iron transport regulator)
MKDKYYILIHKKLTSTLTGEEHSQLEKWLSDSLENQRIYQEIDSTWTNSLDYNNTVVFDHNKAYEKHLNIIETEKKICIKYFSLYKRVAAIFLFVLGSLLVLNTFFNNTEFSTGEYAQSYLLPDGSKVILAEASKITFNKSFNDELRELNLEGKAFFKVAHNPEKPFIVKTTDFETTVLGTEFEVNENSVSVKSGKVSVVSDSEKIILTKNQTVVKQDISKVIAVPENQFDWLNENLVFNNTALPVVLNDIANHFDIKFEYKTNKDYTNCKFTSQSLSHLKLKDIIGIIESSFECVITTQNQSTFLISHIKCK